MADAPPEEQTTEGSAGDAHPEPDAPSAPSRLLLIARAIDAAVYPSSAYQTEAGRKTRVDAVLTILTREILQPVLWAVDSNGELGGEAINGVFVRVRALFA